MGRTRLTRHLGTPECSQSIDWHEIGPTADDIYGGARALPKAEIDDLAVLGGPPAFARPVHVGRPNIGDRESLLERIEQALDRRWLTNDGDLVREFERRISEELGVRHAVAVTNGTVGLEILARALGLTGQVIVPSFTFVATAHAMRWLGLDPVFADIRPDTHTLDPEGVAKRITAETSAILGVHLWGRPCDTEALAALAGEHGLKLLYDAAHAFGVSHRGRMIGCFGDAEVFSFHATKFLNSFEGGAITTDSDELAGRLRLMRNFGFADYDRVDALGINGKMSEVSAAMGLTGLDAIGEFIAVNEANHRRYRERLRSVPGVEVLPYPEGERGNYQYVVLECRPGPGALTRDELLAVLHAENVLARRYFWPGCHRMEPYRTEMPDAHRHLPATVEVADRVLTLPTGTSVDGDAIERICRVVELAAGAAEDEVRRIRARLS